MWLGVSPWHQQWFLQQAIGMILLAVHLNNLWQLLNVGMLNDLNWCRLNPLEPGANDSPAALGAIMEPAGTAIVSSRAIVDSRLCPNPIQTGDPLNVHGDCN